MSGSVPVASITWKSILSLAQDLMTYFLVEPVAPSSYSAATLSLAGYFPAVAASAVAQAVSDAA